MATISGSLRFDPARTSVSSPALQGIQNVPIVLQNTATNAMLAVLTDASGNYAFINVPDGNYRIVEAFGTPASPSPGDFSGAAVGSTAAGVTPPISFVSNPPANATDLDVTTPNTLLVTVSGTDLTGQDILNGPVQYTPIQTIFDTNVVVSPVNLITKADNGTFGDFAAGTPANTGADPNPYPDIGSQFIYVQPNPAFVTPADGQYTIQNLMNNATANEQGTWWRIADHTTGNETGRMMIVNGSNPGSIFFQQQVSVTPNTYYLMSSWILNLSKNPALSDPQLGVQVIGEGGQILFDATLGELIPMQDESPEWKQIGTVINSLDNTSLTVQFISMGPAAFGNDYAIDDIALNPVEVTVYTPQKTASAAAVNLGDTVNYTVTLTNTGNNPLTGVNFKDAVPEGFSFIPGSVIINGASVPGANPDTGFSTPDVPGGTTLTVTFSAAATAIPAVNPPVNNAQITYQYTPVDGGIPNSFSTASNEVAVEIIAADMAITKTGKPNPVETGGALTYTLNVVNNGPGAAQNVTVTDAVSAALAGVEFSTDNGVTWSPWSGSLNLGTTAPGTSAVILIRGTVTQTVSGMITNTASVASSTPDPDPNNNSSTVNTSVNMGTPTSCEDAIKEIISSIAMEELGLSHILNAEGEKLQFVLGTLPGISGPSPTIDQLLTVNESVNQTLRTSVDMQVYLQRKLSDALCLCKKCAVTGASGPAGQSVPY